MTPATAIDTPLAAFATAAGRRDISSVALRLFLRLTDHWGLDGARRMALLGDVARPTFQRWKSKIAAGGTVELSRDQLERISLCLGIEKALQLVFADEAAGQRWLKSANHDLPFAGGIPLERMTAGGIHALHQTRRYLDAWRGVR